MMNKICAAVILFNSPEDVVLNIKTYLYQVDRLYVIDNSTESNPELLEGLSIGKVEYVFNDGNFGISKSLNIAIKKALSDGYEYILTMDQDSKASSNMVKALYEFATTNEKAGIVSPLHSNRYDTHLKNTEEYEKRDIVMTSGNLLSLHVYREVGEFNEDYFIDYVDIEYCFRMKKYGYSVYRLNKYILEHNEADLSSTKFLGKEYYPHNHKAFRFYYKTRNLLMLRKEYRKLFPDLLKIEYDSYYRTLAKVMLFEKERVKKIIMVLKGILDYLRGATGRKF